MNKDQQANQDLTVFEKYFTENKYLESLLLLGDSINSCKTCFDCKRIIEEEQYLMKI